MAKAKSGAATAEKKVTTRRKKMEVAGEVPSNGSNGHTEQSMVVEEQIRIRAYELYERRGRQDGAHESDWFAAEAELRSRTA